MAYEAVVLGLAGNPSAPADVLIRLLEVHGESFDVRQAFRHRRNMPPELIEVMLHHPTTNVRMAIAENLHVDLRIRARLLNDPEPLVIVRIRPDPKQPLPADLIEPVLAGFPRVAELGLLSTGEAREELHLAAYQDPRLKTPIARHPHPQVRAVAADFLDELDPRDQQALRDDDSPVVRAALATRDAYVNRRPVRADDLARGGLIRSGQLSGRVSPAVITSVLGGADIADLVALAKSPGLPLDAVAQLVGHPERAVRASVAQRSDLTPAQLTTLAADSAPAVRNAVSVHPLTETVPVDLTLVDLRFVPPSDRPPEVLARSANPLLRRRAAATPGLPPELVTMLADDAEPGVRTALAFTQEEPPPSLLLRTYLEYLGRDRLALLDRPGFPGRGLAAYATDPDPARRRLAALDPDADPDLLLRLSADENADVRHAIVRCPRLPAERVVALLNDTEVAGDAAANPALPVETMRRLVS